MTDSSFAQAIKIRDGHRCQVCGKPGEVDCSHFIKRRFMLTRWHPLNAYAKCRLCHSYFETHNREFTEWMVNRVGSEVVEYLQRVSKAFAHFTDDEQKAIRKFYKAQLKTMQPGDDLETPAVLLLKIREAGF